MNNKNWDWYISPNKFFIYHYKDSIWRRHLCQPGTHCLYFKASLQITSPPIDLLPASVDTTRRALRVHSYSPYPPPDPPDIPTFHIGPFTFVNTDQQCFFHNLTHSPTLDKLYDCVIQGTSLAVSDGSYFPTHKLGGCGWIISTPDKAEWIKGDCVIPGPRSVHSAYRAELGGLAGIAFFF